YLAQPGQNLLDLINSTAAFVPQICYMESLGPLQTCDTCLVEVDGELARACATTVTAAMNVWTQTELAKKAQKEGLDTILQNHEMYCRYVIITTAAVKFTIR